MCLNELEELLIQKFLEDDGIEIVRRKIDFNLVNVSDRELTGVGFLTQLLSCDELKISATTNSFKWGKCGATLNGEGSMGIETGYLIYIEKGYIDAIEGYTYGEEEWPERITRIEMYNLDL